MLSVHEVTTAYQGLVAISAVSIEVTKGEIVCVAGANGAGKSTLLKSIAGAERPRVGGESGLRCSRESCCWFGRTAMWPARPGIRRSSARIWPNCHGQTVTAKLTRQPMEMPEQPSPR